AYRRLSRYDLRRYGRQSRSKKHPSVNFKTDSKRMKGQDRKIRIFDLSSMGTWRKALAQIGAIQR
ncbi:MAG: hypothetical protein ACLP8A_05195, partial [Methylovirgula sp.]